MNIVKVRGLQKWQHYKHRNPPWIKLYNSIFNDYDFSKLSDESKFHLIGIWSLASVMDNELPYDERWIAARIGANSDIHLSEFLEGNFVEIVDKDTGKAVEIDGEICGASIALATCKQNAHTEKSREETETEKRRKTHTSETRVSAPPIPVNEIVELYHQKLPMLPAVRKLTKSRRSYIQQRWRENDLPSLEVWGKYFDYVGQSDFLCGRTQGKDGRPPFMADLEWITKPANYVKIFEGKYHGV